MGQPDRLLIMTPKERILAVLNGQTPDKVPFAPFGELIPRSTFELKFRNEGMGFIIHHGSVHQHNDTPWFEYHDGDKKTFVLKLASGELSSEYQYKKGASNNSEARDSLSPYQTKFFIQTADDYKSTAEYINSTYFTFDNGDDALIDYYNGDESITHAWTGEPPFMEAQYYLGLENWSYHRCDHPAEFGMLLDALDKLQERRMEYIIKSNQTIINLGNLAGNFSPFDFEKYMLPYFRKYSLLLRKAGKKSSVHADALNLKQHLSLIPLCGVDIAEAFTPPPVGNLSLSEARAAWGDDIVIHINFPESVFYGGYEKTRQFTRDLIREDPCPRKIIGLTEMGFIGVSAVNMVMFKEGIQAILDAVNEYGVY